MLRQLQGKASALEKHRISERQKAPSVERLRCRGSCLPWWPGRLPDCAPSALKQSLALRRGLCSWGSYSVDFALKFLSVSESAFSTESDGTTENVFEPSSPCSNLGSPAVLPPHSLPASLDTASATCSPTLLPHCSGTAAAPTEGLSRGLGMTTGSGRQAPHRKWWDRAWALGRVCTCTSHEGAWYSIIF